MKISVVIPIYNVSEFIERCLRSALNQSYSNIEYLLVDDASSDNSFEIISKVLSDYPEKEVKVIRHEKNKGVGGARNTGVKLSSGDYIFFLDSDDELPVNGIETLSSYLIEKDIDMVVGDMIITGNKPKYYPSLMLREGFYTKEDFILDSFLRGQWYDMCWNKLIKREFFTEKGIWFEEHIYHEDTLWSFQMATAINSLAVINTATYYYHIRENSITQKKTKKNLDDFLFVLERIIEKSLSLDLFSIQPGIFTFLENLNIFYLKNLLSNHLKTEYIKIQKKRIDTLYQLNVWKNRKPSFAYRLKHFLLTLQIKIKTL